MAAASRGVICWNSTFFFFIFKHPGYFPHNGWKILGHTKLALSAKYEMARVDQYIWQNLVARFPTRRLFDAGHLKLLGLGQFVFLLHPDFHEPWPECSFFSYSCWRETGRALEDSEQCYPQFCAVFSSSRFAQGHALGDTRTLHRIKKNYYATKSFTTLNFR